MPHRSGVRKFPFLEVTLLPSPAPLLFRNFRRTVLAWELGRDVASHLFWKATSTVVSETFSRIQPCRDGPPEVEDRDVCQFTEALLFMTSGSSSMTETSWKRTWFSNFALPPASFVSRSWRSVHRPTARLGQLGKGRLGDSSLCPHPKPVLLIAFDDFHPVAERLLCPIEKLAG